MKYSVAHFAFSFAEPWQEDLFTQSLFDIGFDTLDADDAYIQTHLLDTHRTDLQQLVEATDVVQLLSI